MYFLIALLHRCRSLRQPVVFFPLLAVVAMLLSLSSGLIGGTPAMAQEEATGFQPLGDIPPTAQQVTVGVYPINVYSVEIANNTYYADAYVWFRWQGEIDPTATVEFVNAVEEWGMIQTNILEEPETLEDGSLYQVMRIEGRFVQPFVLSDFPLDRQQLTILVEDTTYSSEQLVYIADTKDSGYGDTLKVPGWDITGWSAESLLHRYDSEFGELGKGTLASNFSVLRYGLQIKRPVNYFLWKLLLPLLIILGAGWSTFFLHPSLVEVRTAMPATSLLTTVFLQQSYSDSLPEVGYLVLLDKIYVLAYLVIIATIIEVMVTATWVHNNSEASYARVKRMDRITLIAQVLAFVVGVIAVILL